MNEIYILRTNERNQNLLKEQHACTRTMNERSEKRSNWPISMDIYAWSATMTDNKPNLGLFYHRAPKMFKFFYKRSWFSNIIISVGALTASCTYSLDRGLLLNLVKFFKLYLKR